MFPQTLKMKQHTTIDHDEEDDDDLDASAPASSSAASPSVPLIHHEQLVQGSA